MIESLPPPSPPLAIPVVCGSFRGGRVSQYLAGLIYDDLAARTECAPRLVDIRDVPLLTPPSKNLRPGPDLVPLMADADALVLVVPEYNHRVPTVFKRVLEDAPQHYIRKAVGVCAASNSRDSGPRIFDRLMPVLIKQGLVPIFWEGNYCSVYMMFDRMTGQPLPNATLPRIDRFVDELIWMAAVLRYDRENLPLSS